MKKLLLIIAAISIIPAALQAKMIEKDKGKWINSNAIIQLQSIDDGCKVYYLSIPDYAKVGSFLNSAREVVQKKGAPLSEVFLGIYMPTVDNYVSSSSCEEFLKSINISSYLLQDPRGRFLNLNNKPIK